MANPEHVEIVKKGAEAIEEWRQKHRNETLDLREAKLGRLQLSPTPSARASLTEADLSGANLPDVDLILVDLSHAKLVRAILPHAALVACDLQEVNLSRAFAFNSDFRHTNLSKANLTEAILENASFYYTELIETCFTNSRMGLTQISGCNLSQCIGLETVKHTGPSSIDTETLISSFGGAGNRFTSELMAFFLNAGVPKQLLDALPRILAEVKYYSCFIAYGQPDISFAKRLVGDLISRGVSCWLYDLDATPGKRTWEEITRKRREAEKMIILSSAKSLVRDGVKKEIEEQIDENPDKIVPISLDNLWKEDGFEVKRGYRDLKPFLLERNWADFCDESKYNDSLNRLLKGIKRA